LSRAKAALEQGVEWPMPPFSARCLVVVVFFSACAEPEKDPATVPDNGQTYRDAVATLCGVDEAIGVTSETDVLEIADRRHEYLQAHVKHPDGIYFYTLFRTQGPKEQSTGLREEAAKVKLAKCTLAETLAAEGSRE
jgi:hypothetical protein